MRSSHYLWAGFLILLCAGLELQSFHSTRVLSSLNSIDSLPLPVRVELVGRVISPHFSGPALVFDIENEGRITCYYRHPPALYPLFSGDWVRVWARIERTPAGRLCVVEGLVPYVVG